MKRFLLGIMLALIAFGVNAQQLGKHVVLTSVQTVSYLVTSVATANVVGGSGMTAVLVLCSTDCHVTSGASPTATASDTFIPAKVLVWVWLAGGVDKLAFIRDAADGTAYVTEAP